MLQNQINHFHFLCEPVDVNYMEYNKSMNQIKTSDCSLKKILHKCLVNGFAFRIRIRGFRSNTFFYLSALILMDLSSLGLRNYCVVYC